MAKIKLKTVSRGGRKNWWIEGSGNPDEDCGPYDTKAEAEPVRIGLQRFYDVEEKRKPGSEGAPMPRSQPFKKGADDDDDV